MQSPPSTTLVAVSAVQSADGRVADLDALTQACAATGTRIMLDTTQAAGWLPVDAGAVRVHDLPWLQMAAGAAGNGVPDRPARICMDGIAPHTAGWYAGADRWNSIYGAPLATLDRTPAVSTCRRRGCRGSAPMRRSRCCARWAGMRCTSTRSVSRTDSERELVWHRPTRRSCRCLRTIRYPN